MHIDVGGRRVGDGAPVFIVAELSGNHRQSYEVAVRTVEAMHAAGADAVKVQTFHPWDITLDLDDPAFQARKGTLWEGRKLYSLYEEGAMPWEWVPRLKRVAEDLGLTFFSSPFSTEAVDFLEDLGVAAYKIASPEITHIPLIEYASSKGKPVILSTGIATLGAIDEAVGCCRKAGNEEIAVLKCTTAYPAPLNETNLKAIPGLRDTFGVVAGLSDHTLGIAVPVGAAAVGASIIEKHFVLDRADGGLDAAFSLEPAEFALMVSAIRDVETALGDATFERSAQSAASSRSARSLFAIRDIDAGEAFSNENVAALRPNHGLHPRHLSDIVGRTARIRLARGTPLSWDLIG